MNGHFPIGDISPVKYFLLVSMGLGLLFGFIMPDSEQPLGWVLLQWQLQTVIPILLLILCHLLFIRWRWFSALVSWKQVAVSGLVGSTLFTPLALLIDIHLMGEVEPASLFLALLDEWEGVAPPVTAAWMLMNLPWIMGIEYKKVADTRAKVEKEDGPESPQPQSEPPARFLQLAKIPCYEDVLYMSAELHYLNVVSKEGGNLVLYSLAQAIEEMPSGLGMQIHRSHWVAFDAVQRIEKNGRQGRLVLNSGIELPVSRNRIKEVAEKLS